MSCGLLWGYKVWLKISDKTKQNCRKEKKQTVKYHFFCTTYKYLKPCWSIREMWLRCLCQSSLELGKGKKTAFLIISVQKRSLAGKVSICQYQAWYNSKAALWIVCLMRSPSEWSVSVAWGFTRDTILHMDYFR